MWPLSMAARVLSRQLKNSQSDAHGMFTSLQLLRSAMEDLEDPTGHWIDLIGEISRQRPDLGIMARKRKRVKKISVQGKGV